MKSSSLFLLLVLSFIASLPSRVEGKKLEIGIVSDLTYSQNYTRSLGYLEKAVKKIHSWDIDRCIQLGDSIESMSGDMVEQFSQVNSIYSKYRVKWYPTAGDHDVNSDFVQDSSNHVNEQIFRELLYKNLSLPTSTNLYYSYNVEKYHFVVLYSFDHLGIESRYGNIDFSKIEDAQYNWLLSDLEKSKSKYVIVYTHQPMWYMTGNWLRVHYALREYDTILVMSGHFHYSQVDQYFDGIQYLVVGATGGYTKTGNKNSGDVRLVGKLSLKGKKFDITLYDLDTDEEFIPGSRNSMDRVQQQSIQNSNTAYYKYIPYLFYYNSTSNILGEYCNSSSSYNFSIVGGNAIDVPQNWTFKFFSDPEGLIVTESSHFVPGQWLSVINSTSAVMKQKKNSDISNFSSVELVSFYEPMVDMWYGTPKVVGSLDTTTVTGTLRFTNTWNYENRVYYLYQDIEFLVTNC